MKKQEETNWDKLNKMSDSQIDYSDIPETDNEFWSDTEMVYPHKKTKLTVTIDDDIALWLKQFGNKYNNTMVLYKSVWVAQFGLIKAKSSFPVKI